MLAERGIIAAEDRDALLAGLEEVARELGEGRFPFRDDDEDIHMAIERRLTEIAGPVGGRLHTARSRNDQVVTDLAMFTRECAAQAQEQITRLMAVLLERALEHADWPMPGYTHLQRAQPVYVGHHLLAYFWMLARDRSRFAFTERESGRLPRAPPVSVAHPLLPFFWWPAAARSLLGSPEREGGPLPLGAGALAGVNF